MFGPTAFFLIFYLLFINPALIAVCLSAAPSIYIVCTSPSVAIGSERPDPLETLYQKFEMVKRGRPHNSSHVDLDPRAAFEFFDSFVQSANGPAGLWTYPKGKSGDSKKSIVWNDIKRIDPISNRRAPRLPPTPRM